MVMIGAFLGGTGGTIPAGYGVLSLFWTTGDGLNQQCTFNIVGPQSTTLESDANGQASATMPVGEYTITPVHSGEYVGDGAKTATVASQETTTVIWNATAVPEETVAFESNATISSATWQITKGDSVVASGTGWVPSQIVNLTPGDYVLSVTAYGDSKTLDFSVQADTINTIDTSSLFCKITATCNVSLTAISYNSVTVVSGSDITSTTFDVVRASSSRTIRGTLPSAPSYSGLSTNTIYTQSMSSRTVIPSAATASVTLSCTRTGRVVLMTTNGSLTVPSGHYRLLVLGGGGGGCSASKDSKGEYSSGGGGGGGRATIGEYDLDGTYNVVVGAGGATDEAGESSSFGTYTASGGSNGIQSMGEGGTGGSGGGAGRCEEGWNYDVANGGTGSTFGGGGGSTVQIGNGGDHGGSGAHFYSSTWYDAEDGDSTSVFRSSSSASGGAIGVGPNVSTSNGSWRGGGGGGGWCARGGDGGDFNTSALYRIRGGAGGGGGGGIAGGNGGAGGSVDSDGTCHPGSRGRGYGAGGGGGTLGQDRKAGGGGGGGYGTTYLATDGSTDGTGGSGAQGCVVIQWLSEVTS